LRSEIFELSNRSLLVAGKETTTNLKTSGAVALLENLEQAQKPRS